MPIFRKYVIQKITSMTSWQEFAIDAGGHAHFLNANTLENANTISDTTAPSPAPLAETKYLTD